MTSSATMRPSSVAGNDSSSSDNDDERSSPTSSSYFVVSGAEEDVSTSGTGCQRQQLRDSDEGRREEPRVEQQSVDISVANHQDDDDSHRHRPGSLLAVAPVSSYARNGSRTSIATKSVSGGAEEKSCRSAAMLTLPKVGEGGHGSRSDMELLCRLFPHVPPVTLDCVLLSCAGNVVQCIEQLLRFHQLKPSQVDAPPLPVGANLAAAAAAAAAYAGLPHVLPTYHHHQRYVASSNVEPLAFPVPTGGGLNVTGGKPPTAGAMSLMPATPFNGTDAMQQICGAGGNNAGPRGLPLGFPYPPAALLPTIAGLRYNYSAMMAAAAMAHATSSATVAGSSAVSKATLSGAGGTPLPYGLFAADGYKCTASSTDAEK